MHQKGVLIGHDILQLWAVLLNENTCVQYLIINTTDFKLYWVIGLEGNCAWGIEYSTYQCTRTLATAIHPMVVRAPQLPP